MGIGELVAENQQRGFAPVRGPLEHLLHGGVAVGGGQGDDALVRAGGAHLVQPAPVHLHHRGSGLPGQRRQPGQRPVGIARGDEDLVQGAAAF